MGEFNEKLNFAFDYDYWLRCQTVAGTPGRLHTPLSVFRIQPDSKGNTSFQKQFAEDYKVIKKFTNNPATLILHKLGGLLTNLGYQRLK